MLAGFCLLMTVAATAQKRYLQVGDQMPDVVLNNMENYPLGHARISDFRGKLVIIDFWDRYCMGCIESFPRQEAIQAQFKDRLQIITVTKNSKEQIDSLFMQPWMVKNKRRRPALPSLMGDTALSGLFPPFFYVPHHIWIDGRGRILYITGGYNATVGHIRSVLEGKHPFMLPKTDDLNRDAELDEKPLAALASGKLLDHVRYGSFFMNFSEAFSPQAIMAKHIDTARQIFRMDYLNFSILSLFREAFTEGKMDLSGNNFYDDNRIEWKVKKNSAFFPMRNYDSLDEWTVRNCYSYEQMIPLKDQPNRYRLMQEDINRYFSGLLGIRAKVVTIRKKCLVLVNTKPHMPKATGNAPKQQIFSKEGEFPQWHGYINTPFRQIVQGLFSDYPVILKDQPFPFIDETAFTGNADLKYDRTARSVADLNRQLSPYGLKIITADRSIKMLQIEKAKKYE